LEQRVQQLEEHKERLSMAESRRIAQIFKQKYEQDLAQLRERLTKYVGVYWIKFKKYKK
jgi:hypothetical protein